MPCYCWLLLILIRLSNSFSKIFLSLQQNPLGLKTMKKLFLLGQTAVTLAVICGLSCKGKTNLAKLSQSLATQTSQSEGLESQNNVLHTPTIHTPTTIGNESTEFEGIVQDEKKEKEREEEWRKAGSDVTPPNSFLLLTAKVHKGIGDQIVFEIDHVGTYECLRKFLRNATLTCQDPNSLVRRATRGIGGDESNEFTFMQKAAWKKEFGEVDDEAWNKERKYKKGIKGFVELGVVKEGGGLYAKVYKEPKMEVVETTGYFEYVALDTNGKTKSTLMPVPKSDKIKGFAAFSYCEKEASKNKGEYKSIPSALEGKTLILSVPELKMENGKVVAAFEKKYELCKRDDNDDFYLKWTP